MVYSSVIIAVGDHFSGVANLLNRPHNRTDKNSSGDYKKQNKKKKNKRNNEIPGFDLIVDLVKRNHIPDRTDLFILRIGDNFCKRDYLFAR